MANISGIFAFGRMLDWRLAKCGASLLQGVLFTNESQPELTPLFFLDLMEFWGIHGRRLPWFLQWIYLDFLVVESLWNRVPTDHTDA